MSMLTDVMETVHDTFQRKKEGELLGGGGSMDGEELAYTNFDLGITFQPWQSLKLMGEGGNVWVVGMASDDQLSGSRGSVALRDLIIQIGIQRKITERRPEAQYEQGKQVLNLEDQLRYICRRELKGFTVNGRHYQWHQADTLRDESGTPYSYNLLREASTFETFFTVYYRTTLA